jgi:hypothetical protein
MWMLLVASFLLCGREYLLNLGPRVIHVSIQHAHSAGTTVLSLQITRFLLSLLLFQTSDLRGRFRLLGRWLTLLMLVRLVGLVLLLVVVAMLL